MPEGYQRVVRPPRGGPEGLLLSVTKVNDVCDPCLKRGLSLSVTDIVLDGWRRLIKTADAVDAVGEPPSETKMQEEPTAVLRAHDQRQEEERQDTKSRAVVDKQRIQRRLSDYRKQNGLGCLEAVAKAARKKTITASVLRDIVIGQAVLPASEWRAVERALDKLERGTDAAAMEGSNGEDA